MASGTQAHTRVYDTSGRLVRYRLGGSIRDLTYDAANRITAYTHYDATTAATQPSLNQSFAYDELGRLRVITTATSSWAIGYDANGNRTGVSLNGTTSAYTTATTSNRLQSTTNPARSFGYDNAGNTISGPYTANYDSAGRMSSTVRSGVTAYYYYNSLGQRIRKTSSAGVSAAVIYVY